MSNGDDVALMSRRADAPDGKLTSHLDLMISEDLNESLIALARVNGFQNRSEYVRNVLHRAVYGEMDTLRLLARSLNRNPGNTG